MSQALGVILICLRLSAGICLAGSVPVNFGRSGKTVPARIDKELSPRSVFLQAFGRTWTEPASVKGGIAEIEPPAVRVATVFSIVSADPAGSKVGELVAYPDAPSNWDQQPAVYAAGTAWWFSQWAQAVGIPLRPLRPEALPRALASRRREDREVLILGRAAAGKDLTRAREIAQRRAVAVLVLEADWFGRAEAPKGGVAVSPREMAGALADVHKQKWHRPLRFDHRHPPWAGISNRQAWMQGQDWPLVEELLVPKSSHRVVLSYVPWAQQLGRRGQADEILVTILRAVGSGRKKPVLWRRLQVLHPPARQMERRQRPVLAAALSDVRPVPDKAQPAYVLDLRGPKPADVALATSLKAVQQTASPDRPVLILGDDPLLAKCQWLKLDREKRQSRTRGVIWLAEDELPPSSRSQVRLMQALTQCGVPLRDEKREKSDENGKI